MPRRTPPRPSTPALPRGVRIVHEDEDILVLDKPVGLLSAVVADGAHREDEPSVFGLVKEYLRGHRKGSTRRAWIVHRLDKEVSGLMVFAKTEGAFNWFKEDLRQRRVERTYLALVEGVVDASVPRRAEEGVEVLVRRGPGGEIEGSIRSRLGERGDGRMGSVASRSPARAPAQDRPGREGDAEREEDQAEDVEGLESRGKLAVTHWRVLATGPRRDLTLLAVRLDTGRRNQIRVHCREMGHTIVGDRRYGAVGDPLKRVGLHATTLAFRHPRSGEPMRFRSPPPEGMLRPLGLDVETALARLDRGAGRGDGGEGGWDHVAEWYDEMIGGQGSARDGGREGSRGGARDAARGGRAERRGEFSEPSPGRARREGGSDHYEQVILPGALHLLEPRQGMRVLDLACGQGVLARSLSRIGVTTLGVDASARLVEMARGAAHGDPRQHFEIGDVRALDVAALGGPGSFDAVTCIMALMNIEPIEPLLRSAVSLLRPGGRFVAVLLHPAFRSPGQTSWGWAGADAAVDEEEATEGRARGGVPSRTRRTARIDSRPGPPPRREAPGAPEAGSAEEIRQFRRVDAYLSPSQREIVMNPGAAAQGRDAVTTTTHHRPIQTYIKHFVAAGLLIDAFEEWPSQRRSAPGPSAAEENRARREIPMFLGLRGRRGGG